ncbi:MAG TPA: hypothetical protein VGJ93_09695 [Desulfuromonadaceae bacterium]|jgi:hypothetical protein
MLSIYHKYNKSLLGLLLALVISLCCDVFAAKAMDVATLEPIVDGLRTPLKFVIDTNGDLCVADPRSGGIVVVNQYGKLVKVLPTSKPITSVALLNSNNNISGGKYIAALGDRVAVLDAEGAEIALLGLGAGQFVKTAGIAVSPDGNIYVVDAGANQIKVFNSSGKYSFPFGSGQFKLPNGIGIFTESGSVRVAVTDIMGGKVEVFDAAGVHQRTIGTPGAGLNSGIVGPLYFYYPSGIAFEYKDNALFRIYVVDMYLGQVQAIDAVSYSFLGNIGSLGNDAGKLITPSDVQFDQVNKRLLVANGWSNLVSFGIDGGQNPVNMVPPALIINNPNATVDTPSIVLTGSVDAGCTLTASVNTSGRAGAASFSSATSWMIPVNGLIPGNNKISIIARNGYGTTVTKTANVQYSPPTAALSINSFPSLTSQSTITLSGVSEPGSYIYINNADARVSGQADVSGSGSWTYNLTLVEGINNIEVSASRFGATAAFKTITIILDTVAPVLTVSAMADGSSSATPIQNISGTAIDPNLSSVTVNGAQVPVSNGAFSYAITLDKGPNIITVVASDSLGNTRTNTRTINFDPALPVISVATPADGAYTNLGDIVVSGRVDKQASVTVNGVPANPGGGLDWNATIRLASGMNTIRIAATDQYGSVAWQPRTIFYDTIMPDVAITSPPQDLALKSPGMTIKGLVGDNTGIKSIKATINGIDRQVALKNGEFSLFADFTAEGPYAIAVSVTDMAGNTTTVVRTIVYDITPPSLTVEPVTVAYPVQISGSVEAGASIVVKDAAGISGRVTIAGQKWTADFSGRVYDPATLVAQATDPAGNVSINRISFPVTTGGGDPASQPEVIYGDIDGDGAVTLADAMVVLRLVVLNEVPTKQQLLHGDVGPLLDGKVNPKGKLDIVDVVLILRKAMGLLSWN